MKKQTKAVKPTKHNNNVRDINKKKRYKTWIIWVPAIVLFIINIILYNAAMGHITLDIFETNNIEWRQRNLIYYVCVFVDVLLFWWLIIIYKKARRAVSLLTAEIACIIQILLCISKVKL